MEGEVGVGSVMKDEVLGWDDEVSVDEDQIMGTRHAGSQKQAQVSKITAVGSTGAGLSGDVSGNVAPILVRVLPPVSGCGAVCDVDFLSCFRSLGGVVLQSYESRGGQRIGAAGSGLEPLMTVEPDVHVQVM